MHTPIRNRIRTERGGRIRIRMYVSTCVHVPTWCMVSTWIFYDLTSWLLRVPRESKLCAMSLIFLRRGDINRIDKKLSILFISPLLFGRFVIRGRFPLLCSTRSPTLNDMCCLRQSVWAFCKAFALSNCYFALSNAFRRMWIHVGENGRVLLRPC